ncbi:MAG TPA: TonB-dependent receptor, partial [Chitinophagaceae bacterium]|nr:TonB-dependent receptor [Chitinophagaceae bacterium]
KTSRTINYAGMEKPGEPYHNETDNYKQDHYQLFFDHRVTEQLSLNTGFFYVKGSGYYEQYKADQAYEGYGLPERVVDNTITSRTDIIRQLWLDNDFYGNIFSLLHKTASKQITFGGAITRYKGDHFGELVWAMHGMEEPKHRWYDLAADKKDFNLFTKWQQHLSPEVQLFADLQYRTVRYFIDGFRDNPGLRIDNTYHFINPKAGITYNNSGWQFFSSYSIGNKEPNRDDFEAGNYQQPKREQLHDLEIGIERNHSRLSWAATMYYMRYKDQLVLTGKINDVGAYTRTNIDDSYRFGIELQNKAVLTDWLHWNGNVTLSRNKVEGFTEYIDDYDNGGQKANWYSETDLSFSPGLVGAGTVVILPGKGLEVNLISKYVGKQFLDNTQNETRKLRPFFTEDLLISYSFDKPVWKHAKLLFQVSNLFNAKYEPNGYTFSYYAGNQLSTENFYYPMAGINCMIGVNIRFEKEREN